jgi:hypothetical protein
LARSRFTLLTTSEHCICWQRGGDGIVVVVVAAAFFLFDYFAIFKFKTVPSLEVKKQHLLLLVDTKDGGRRCF